MSLRAWQNSLKSVTRVIFDIETVGKDFDSLDDATREYLLRWAETEREIQEVKESLSFYPLTGEIIAIGMLNPETQKGAVYFQADELLLPFEEDGIRYEICSEKDILTKFWGAVKSCKAFITFNGRAFDCPFILVRSAVHKIKPLRDLMPNRYSGPHIDLLDQLTFFGAVKRKFNLDMWCKTFGIESPKSEITGYEVKGLFDNKRYTDIARYCAKDLRATRELLYRWENYIKFSA
ncbi:MAG: ribonuclease H-like domain-containing protein [Nitrospirae bacterium]|nr:ribonuclease H-like domain-containing protein [Nitrospirota bacterium]